MRLISNMRKEWLKMLQNLYGESVLLTRGSKIKRNNKLPQVKITVLQLHLIP